MKIILLCASQANQKALAHKIHDLFKLEKIIEGFSSPWSLTFVDNQNLLIT